MQYVFLVNPTAGTGYAGQVIRKLEPILKEKQTDYRIVESRYVGHCTELAARMAKDPEIKAVVAVGGDGTVSETAEGLCGTRKPMGIIPAGTGNDLIKSVGIPKDPEKALEALLERTASPVDTGTVNDRFFLNVCGTGFDVTVLDYTLAYKKRFRGLLPYLLGLLKAVSHYRPVYLEVTRDGRREAGEYLVCTIANGKYIGGGIPICPAADISDGKLNLILIRNVPRWKIPFYLPGLMLSQDLKFSITRHEAVESIRLLGQAMRINVDGDIRELEDVTFRIQPATLMLIH